MDINYSASIIIPAYNEQETIEECLSNIIEESKKAKEFQKVAKKCTCTFECANAINTVYDPKHWASLL